MTATRLCSNLLALATSLLVACGGNTAPTTSGAALAPQGVMTQTAVGTSTVVARSTASASATYAAVPTSAAVTTQPPIARVPGQNPQLISIEAPGGKTISAAVAWPEGPGPFPAIILLHGTSGYKQSDVTLAQDFAKSGFVALTGCWFAGNPGATAPPDAIACSNGPAYKGVSVEATRDVRVLVDTAKRLEGVRASSIGLWGQSRGATMALVVASSSSDTPAVVATSAAYTQLGGSGPGCIGCTGTPELVQFPLVRELRSAVLILHATADETVPVQQARHYEGALKETGKTYDAYYYEGGSHSFVYAPPALRNDALQRAIAFYKKHLAQ